MIKKIKWKSYSILGNLELDFTKNDGSIYNTIILAGENGVGKTTVLDTLANFLNLGSIEPFEYISYELNNSVFLLETTEDLNANLGFHLRKNMSNETSERITTNKSSLKKIEDDNADIRHYGCVYSKARSGFKTAKVDATTNAQLDNEKYINDDKDDFTSIKHLFVDITSQDNALWRKLSKVDKTLSIEDFETTYSKMTRFQSAFNSFFDAMTYNEINEEDPEEKKILFEKNGKMIEIDNLSTGEKQIVYRGAMLLQNSKNITGGMVLIDEPELSMHPRWQQKILSYYRGLFNSDGKQTVQMIIATHSEYVIKAALEDPNNVLVIVLRSNNDSILPQKIITPTALPKITAAETNYIAFDLATIDYHIELYGYLQNKTGKKTVKACDDYIAAQACYKPSKHERKSSYGTIPYQTLPTYIRNSIDHPDQEHEFTTEDLICSIELLIDLCT